MCRRVSVRKKKCKERSGGSERERKEGGEKKSYSPRRIVLNYLLLPLAVEASASSSSLLHY